MKRLKLNSKPIFLFLIIILLGSNVHLFSAEKDKIKDEKDKKVKEIKEKKDKIEKLPDTKDKTETINIITEKIHTEKINPSIIDKITNIKTNDKIEKENQVKTFTKTLEDLQIKNDSIIRDIKLSTPGDIVDIKEKLKYTKEIIQLIEEKDIEFINNLNKEEKELIKKQNNTIKNSKKNLIKILENLDKELDKKNKNIEDLFNKTKELEKETRTIYRQYRAIEWILFEK